MQYKSQPHGEPCLVNNFRCQCQLTEFGRSGRVQCQRHTRIRSAEAAAVGRNPSGGAANRWRKREERRDEEHELTGDV